MLPSGGWNWNKESNSIQKFAPVRLEIISMSKIINVEVSFESELLFIINIIMKRTFTFPFFQNGFLSIVQLQ